MTERTFSRLAASAFKFRFNTILTYGARKGTSPVYLYVSRLEFLPDNEHVKVTGQDVGGNAVTAVFHFKDIRKIEYSRRNMIRVSAEMERIKSIRDWYVKNPTVFSNEIRTADARLAELGRLNPDSFIYR